MGKPEPINWTPEKELAFCAVLAEVGIVARACRAIKVSRQSAYTRRETSEAFAKRWDKALDIGISALEDEAHRRGFEGFDEPVFHQGEIVGAVRKHSDTLAIFLLKAHKPDKYRERYDMRVAGQVDVVLDRDTALLEAARAMAYILTAAEKPAIEGESVLVDNP